MFIYCMTVPCVVFESVWNMQLVKCVQNLGIVEAEEEAEVEAEVEEEWVVVARRLAVHLTRLTAASHAMSVVITRTTVLVLVEVVTMNVAGGTGFLFFCSLRMHIICHV